jgi:rod shape-determining protein MreC
VVVYRQDRRRRVTLVLLVITSLALMSLDERGSGVINSARTAAQDVVSPLQSLADDVINPASDWLDGLGRANELQAENQRLSRQLADARSAVAAAKGSLAELKTLRGILDLPNVADADAVTAEVVTQSADNFSRTFRISKGSDKGIAKGMSVVVGNSDGAALVGQVVAVSKSAATVRRIDDRNFGVGAQLVQSAGSGPAGTAAGQADSSLLRFSVIVDSAAGVVLKKGDVAVTLGADEYFPKNLAIGTIVHKVGAGGAINRDAELRPVVDLDALTFVKVLKLPPVTVP